LLETVELVRRDLPYDLRKDLENDRPQRQTASSMGSVYRQKVTTRNLNAQKFKDCNNYSRFLLDPGLIFGSRLGRKALP